MGSKLTERLRAAATKRAQLRWQPEEMKLLREAASALEQAEKALLHVEQEGHRFKPWWAGGQDGEHSDNCLGCYAREALAALERE